MLRVFNLKRTFSFDARCLYIYFNSSASLFQVGSPLKSSWKEVKISARASHKQPQIKKLSYTRMREVIIARLKETAPAGLRLGLHSLRASGATAAGGSGLSDRVCKRHGRWSSNAAFGYVKDSISCRLQVSKNLGL